MPRKSTRELDNSDMIEDNAMEHQDIKTVPTNFRVTKATADKFRKFASEFPNQDYALSAMVEAYERTELQKSLPAYEKDIETFQRYANMLVSKYVGVLADYSVVEEKAKAGVHTLLENKDATISELASELSAMRASVKERDEAVKRAEAAERRMKQLEKEKSELVVEGELQRKQYSASVNDKEIINQGLRDQITALEEKLQGYLGVPGQLQALNEELAAKEQERRELEYTHQLSDVEKEKQSNAALEYQRQKHIEEMDALRQKYDSREEEIRLQYEKRIDVILNGMRQERNGDVGPVAKIDAE